jgi:hypothetical protein
VTATGLLLGITQAFSVNYGFLFLTPLVFLLPSWSIFFDKAKTITRIVGYQRIVEKLLLGTCHVKYQGWENALSKFRDNEEYEPQIKGRIIKQLNDEKIAKQKQMTKQGMNFNKRGYFLSDYWMHVYFVFLWLSLLCIALAIATTNFSVTPVLAIGITTGATVAFAYIFAKNTKAVQQLSKGKYHSYDVNAKYWEVLLKGKEKTLMSYETSS